MSDLVPIGGLALIVLAAFAEALPAGRSFYYRDLHLLWHPQIASFVSIVKSGAWPLWNPDVSFGLPLLANPNAQVLYPPTWLALLMPPLVYLKLYIIGHVFLSSVGAYLLARRLSLSPLSAFTSASIWTLSGTLLSLPTLWNHLGGAACLPWCLLFGDRALGSTRWRPALVWGVFWAVLILIGSPESALLALALVVVLAAWRAWDRRPVLRRSLRSLAIALGCGAALSAAQWIPTLDIMQRSSRTTMTPAAREFWSLHPVGLLEAFLPLRLHDLPLRPEHRAALFELREPLIRSPYLGLAALSLAGLGFIGRHRRLGVLLALTMVATALLALGRHSLAFDTAAWLFPPLRVMRFPAKALIATAFAFSLLCGLGAETTLRLKRATRHRGVILALVPAILLITMSAALIALIMGRAGEIAAALFVPIQGHSPRSLLAPALDRLWIATGLGLAAVIFFLAAGARISPRLRCAAILAAALTDLFVANRDINPTIPTSVLTTPPSLAEQVRTLDASRTYVVDYFEGDRSARYLPEGRLALKRRRQDWPVRWLDVAALRGYLQPPTLGLWGIPSSFERDWLELQPARLRAFTSFLSFSEETPLHVRLLQMGGVGRVIALHTRGFEELTPLSVTPSLFERPITVLRVNNPLPRTYVVGTVRVSRGGDVARILGDPDFDPRREVILDEGVSMPAASDFHGRSRIVSMTPNRVRIEVELSAAGCVVLLDTFDEGWRARVDGRDAAVRRANAAFRAVQAPSGKHVVEFWYQPASVMIGAAVSVLTALFLVAMLVRAERSAQRGRRSADNDASRQATSVI